MNPGAPSSTPQSSLHPRNRHGGRYDFAVLTACCPELAAHVAANAFGDDSIDFSDPLAVRVGSATFALRRYEASRVLVALEA